MDAKSFRPISLTFLLKGLERLVDQFIRFIDGGHFTGKSTETTLQGLTEKNEKAMFVKEYALGAFMDIEDAFNYALFAVIYDAARHHEINPLLIS